MTARHSKNMTKTPEIRSKKEYIALVERAKAAAEKYYNSDTLLASDDEYDTMLRGITDAEKKHPSWKIEHHLTDEVAGGTAKKTDVTHMTGMLSLDNCYNEEDLEKWLTSRNCKEFTTEPKYDGLSLAARYSGGKLVRLATRGDGTRGEDVTFALSRIEGLATTVENTGDFEIRGEIVFKEKNYEQANAARVALGKTPFANMRNAAAGTLRSENLEYPVILSFYAHGQAGLDETGSHHQTMLAIGGMGINVNTGKHGLQLHTDLASVKNAVKLFQQSRLTMDVEVDGIVVKVDGHKEQKTLGNSSKAPRWGIAYKYPAMEVTSTLEKVEWTVGRTGRITPRATITPVSINGTTVTYATLHNADDIKRKDIRLLDKVLVKRAGEVIPRIEASLPALRDGTQSPIKVPTVCPRCGGPIDKQDAIWKCVKGRKCALPESIEYAVGRDCLDIEGLGPKLVAELIKAGHVNSVADLFTLTAEQMNACERMGDLRTANILAQIEKAKTKELDKVFCSLGIAGTGRSMSRRLARHFKSIQAILDASVEDLEKVDGIGPEKSSGIHEELQELSDTIKKLRANGVAMQYAQDVQTSALSGKTFCVTGSMTGRLQDKSRQEVHALIEAAGGKTSGSVSAKTSYLVSGDKAGSKYDKATQLGVTIISPDQLAEMLENNE